MQPWQAAALTPHEALQAIVAARHGDDWAASLKAWKHLWALQVSEGGRPIADAFRRAAEDLQSWARQGWIVGHGRRQIGWRLTDERELIGDCWANEHCFDFDKSCLNGDPRYERVTLRGEDVRSLARPSGQVSGKDKRRRGALPNSNWSAVEALVEGKIEAEGWPEDEEGPPNWRCQADVAKFMADEMGSRDQYPASSTVRSHAKKLLDRLRPTKADN